MNDVSESVEGQVGLTLSNRDNASVRRILRAAGIAFGASGYHPTSMQEIARQAGVSKSLVHYHFDSKEHLFLEVQLDLLRDLLQYVRALTQSGAQRSVAKFDQALDEVRAYVERDIEHIRVMLEFHNVARNNPRIAMHVATFQQELIALVVTGIHNVLEPAMVERLAVEPERLARLLLQAFNGLVVDLAYAQGDAAVQRVRQTFEDLRALLTSALFK